MRNYSLFQNVHIDSTNVQSFPRYSSPILFCKPVPIDLDWDGGGGATWSLVNYDQGVAVAAVIFGGTVWVRRG